MNKIGTRICAVTALAAAAMAGSAHASLTTITFNGLAPAGSYASFGHGPLVLSGVTFTSPSFMYAVDPKYYSSSYAGGDFFDSNFPPSGLNVVTAVLPKPATTVGFDFGGLFGGPVTVSVMLSNGDMFTDTTTRSIVGTNSLAFTEFTAATPFTSVEISMPDLPNYNALDNFTFGSVSVPEPASWTMMLLGFGLVGAIIRRRSPKLA